MTIEPIIKEKPATLEEYPDILMGSTFYIPTVGDVDFGWWISIPAVNKLINWEQFYNQNNN